MHDQQENVLARRTREQRDAQQRSVLQVKGAVRLRHEVRADFSVAPARGILYLEKHLLALHHSLYRLPVHGRESRAQRCMAVDQHLKGLPECWDVDLGADAHGIGNVVGRASWCKLLQEPERSLAVGQRMRTVYLLTGGATRCGARWFGQRGTYLGCQLDDTQILEQRGER